MSEHYEPWRHTRQKRSRDEPFHTVRRSNPHRNGCTHSAPPSTHRHAHRPASSAEQDSSEINERPPPRQANLTGASFSAKTVLKQAC